MGARAEIIRAQFKPHITYDFVQYSTQILHILARLEFLLFVHLLFYRGRTQRVTGVHNLLLPLKLLTMPLLL